MRRRRIDWDEELKKTEQIRRKGFFLSGLSFGLSALLIYGASHLNKESIVFSKKIVATFFLLLFMLIVGGLLHRRKRLRQKQEESDPK